MSFAIRVAIARPTLLPICDMVLKTPPAKPCVLAGNSDVMSKFEIVNNAPSAIGFKEIAGNVQAQYEDLEFEVVTKTGAMQEAMIAMSAIQSARTRDTINPIKILINTPAKGAGRKRRAACRALRPCAF